MVVNNLKNLWIENNCIKKLRVWRGLTRQELADIIGVHINTLANIENKTRRRFESDLIKKIAKALNVKQDMLFENMNKWTNM